MSRTSFTIEISLTGVGKMELACPWQGCGKSADWMLHCPPDPQYYPCACDKHKHFLQEVIDGERSFYLLQRFPIQELVAPLREDARSLLRRISALPPAEGWSKEQLRANDSATDLVEALEIMEGYGSAG